MITIDCFLPIFSPLYKILGLVASSPVMTYQSVPVQPGQGSMQTGVQPGYQHMGIPNNFLSI
jgi:hypothetical protein